MRMAKIATITPVFVAIRMLSNEVCAPEPTPTHPEAVRSGGNGLVRVLQSDVLQRRVDLPEDRFVLSECQRQNSLLAANCPRHHQAICAGQLQLHFGTYRGEPIGPRCDPAMGDIHNRDLHIAASCYPQSR
jgi:hypothetical protein